MADSARPRYAPGVRLLLAAVALVPIVGLIWLGTAAVEDARSQARDAVEITELSARVDEAIRMEALIDTESFWAHAVASLTEFGIPLDVIREMTDIDVEAGLAEAADAVDEELATQQLPETVAFLEDARALVTPGRNNRGIEDAYDLAEDRVGASIDDALAEIRRLSIGVEAGVDLNELVRILEISAALRNDVSSMNETYFSSRFPLGSEAGLEVERLLQHRVGYQDTLDGLKPLVPDASALKTLWLDIDADPAVVVFFERVDALNDAVVASGTGGDAFDAGISFGEIPAEAEAFVAALETVSRHVDFVEAVSGEIGMAAATIRAQAEEERQQTLILVTALGAAALVAVLAASLWIVRPLRHMASVVEQLRSGDLGDPVREAGPAEVRAAARALNEAVDHISAAEQQATALAAEDLDSPALHLHPTGRLGESLRTAVAALASHLAEREEFRKRLAHEAAHDGLTGLANRSATMAHLGQALARAGRSDGDVAVLFVDIDGFKSVNDQHGHAAGDHVLRIVAQRITTAIRQGDHVGRIGGDEFVVVAEPVDSVDQAVELASGVLGAVARPVSVAGVEASVTASVGVAIATAASTPEAILRDADLAVYEAKAEGRAQVYLCDDAIKLRQQHRLDIEHALELAIESDDLTLHYQPIVDATTGMLSSVEALLRWQRPSGEFESPGEFIPIAERSDLILAVDRWVLGQAAVQLEQWTGHPQLGELSVSVNLSARHLTDPTLVRDVLGPLRTRNVDPHRLTVELTETALLGDLNRAARGLNELRAAGVRVAIDDFGTGYASLAHLRQLPIDILKIDQSFVAGIDRHDDRSLVQLTIDTGHLLGATITAEGVETGEQASQLTAMGTDLLQGFGTGRPMPPEHLEAWAAMTGGAAAERIRASVADAN